MSENIFESPSDRAGAAHPLLRRPVVLNLGVDLFADALRRQSVDVIQLRWTPPRETDDDLLALLDDLL